MNCNIEICFVLFLVYVCVCELKFHVASNLLLYSRMTFNFDPSASNPLIQESEAGNTTLKFCGCIRVCVSAAMYMTSLSVGLASSCFGYTILVSEPKALCMEGKLYLWSHIPIPHKFSNVGHFIWDITTFLCMLVSFVYIFQILKP